MVVTASLARGAVRAAANKHSAAAESAFARLLTEGVRPPATPRGFGDWFRRHRAIMERDALLIVYGKIGRRRGGFSAFVPQFTEVDSGWIFGIHRLRIEFSPGHTESFEWEQLPVRVSGHALERMFQRINTIEWPVIRDCLAGATLFANAMASAFSAAGLAQCAVPAEKGMLIGNVDGELLNLRTFLPESQLTERWQSRYDELRALAEEGRAAMQRAALAPDDEPEELLRAGLTAGRHGWMRLAYVPGVDPLEDAWRSKL